ncbi:MAG: hypothetical protein M0Z33_12675 [Actinomycetota bacterium]|nr:hypothetical protein [Actinomycetota bacterium]
MSISSISGVLRPAPSSPLVPTPTAAGARDSSAKRPAGTSGVSSSVLSSLTPGDRALIAAATGVEISPDGTVVRGADYAGSGGAAAQFMSVIAAARQLGQLAGPITAKELASLFPPYVTTGSGATVDPAHVAKAVLAVSGGPTAGPGPGAGLDARA